MEMKLDLVQMTRDNHELYVREQKANEKKLTVNFSGIENPILILSALAFALTFILAL